MNCLLHAPAVLPPGIEPKWPNNKSKLPNTVAIKRETFQNHDAESNPVQQIRNKSIIKPPRLIVAIYFIVYHFPTFIIKSLKITDIARGQH
jgi:hypothetical protein